MVQRDRGCAGYWRILHRQLWTKNGAKEEKVIAPSMQNQIRRDKLQW